MEDVGVFDRKLIHGDLAPTGVQQQAPGDTQTRAIMPQPKTSRENKFD